MKKQLKRFISVSLIVCICTVIGSSFLPEPIFDGKQKTNFTVTVHATGADVVITEVTSAWLLELLASLGISAETYGLLSSRSKADFAIENYEEAMRRYRPEEYATTADSSSGSISSTINDFANKVSYKITHSDAAVSKTLSDGFIGRLEKALENPKAAEEFQKLIEAAQNGMEITGGMVKNLWLMLTKGVIDDCNDILENEVESFQSNWCEEWDVFKYNYWSDDMKTAYHSGYSDYVFFHNGSDYCVVFYPDGMLNSSSLVFDMLFDNTIFGLPVSKPYDCYLFRFNSAKYYPDDLANGWLNSYSDNGYGKITYGAGTDKVDGFYYDVFVGWKTDILDWIFGIPIPGTGDIAGDTAEDKPYILNPSDVITKLPEKIANDDVISIPDGTTIEDIAVPLPGDVTADPSLPGVGTPTLVGEVVGNLVPVDDIDFPWENVANPDLPVDPSVPADPAVPANPDYELDPKDYKIKPIIIEKFPFCIPWDVVKCVSLLGQTPEVPKFEYRFYIKSLNIDETIVLDLKDFEPVANVSRWFFRILFIFGLAVATRNLIRG